MCKATCFLEGMVIGVAAGVGLVIAGKMMVDNSHKLTKGKDKLERAVSEFVDGVQTMIK
ncbi:MAG: hypothetical protein U0M42_03740 [Acutalibacteraceae bacterium]|nr:hypothetical protein [Acutalibacteraceae bacterium]